MKRFALVSLMTLVAGAAAAQTPAAPPAPSSDDVQHLQLSLSLTEQELDMAQKAFVSERAQTIILGRQINELQAENKKLKEAAAEATKKAPPAPPTQPAPAPAPPAPAPAPVPAPAPAPAPAK